jgi:cytidylate kinase
MKQFVLAITGPAGSGKSTVGEKVAKKLERCVNIDADHVKHMIVSGFYKDENNPAGWGYNQWELVGDSIGLLVANFLKEGYNVIINGYLDEASWPNIEKHAEITHKVLLLPNLDTLVDRDASRSGDAVMGKQAVTQHHDTFSNSSFYKSFTPIDTSNHTVDETVNEILKIIE